MATKYRWLVFTSFPVLFVLFYVSQGYPAHETSDDYVTAEFMANGTYRMYEGNVTFGATTISTACGRNIVSNEGIIYSPNFPNNYGSHENCIWRITVQEGYIVELKFKFFQLEEDVTCKYDYVTILDGLAASSPILGTFCGRSTPAVTVSSGNTMTVLFRSDSDVQYKGFTAEFKKGACGGNFVSSEGNISSPNFPDTYEPKQYCTWKITVQQGAKVDLNFNFFELEADGSCKYDYVKILDGHESSSPTLGTFCGNRAPSIPISSTNKISIVFSSDDSDQYKGFTAAFKEVFCGGNITADEGNISSPNFPNNYGKYEDCIWRITVEQGYLVVLRFTAFQVEHHSECKYDYVKISDGHESNSPILGVFCGHGIPDVPVSSGNKLRVEFRTDAIDHFGGFSAIFRKVRAEDAQINHTIIASVSTEEPTIMTSVSREEENVTTAIDLSDEQNTKADNTMNVTEETTTISAEATATPKSLTTSAATHSSTSNTQSEEPDTTEIFTWAETTSTSNSSPDAQTTTSRENSATNQTVIPSVTTAKETTVAIVLANEQITVAYNTMDAVTTTVEITTSGVCGGSIVANEGNISSPNYPSNYGSNEHCIWRITVQEGYPVVLRFKFFELEVDDRCSYDYVRILDGHDPSSRILTTFCGAIMPGVTISSGNKMTVVFASDDMDEYKGFTAEFKKGACGKINVYNEGSISSPNYPDRYEGNEMCVWWITVPKGDQVVLTFTSFQLEDHRECKYDYVKILDGHESNSTILGEFCGNDYRDVTVSSGNKMTVEFKTDSRDHYLGFTATFNKSKIAATTYQTAMTTHSSMKTTSTAIFTSTTGTTPTMTDASTYEATTTAKDAASERTTTAKYSTDEQITTANEPKDTTTKNSSSDEESTTSVSNNHSVNHIYIAGLMGGAAVLVIAIILVVLVVLVFLRNRRSSENESMGEDIELHHGGKNSDLADS